MDTICVNIFIGKDWFIDLLIDLLFDWFIDLLIDLLFDWFNLISY